MKRFLVFLLIFFPLYLFGQEEVTINSFISGDQRSPQLISDHNGNFIAVWTSSNQVNEFSEEDIFIQKFDENMNMLGNEIQVNDSVNGRQIYPDAAMNDNGDYVVVWASFVSFTNLYDIKSKIYNNEGAVSDEFLVNTVTANTQTKPTVDILEDGSFIVAWESWYEDGSDRGIFAQRFTAEGVKAGETFLVNSTTQYSQAKPSVKYFPGGKFVIVWESWSQEEAVNPGYGIFGRIFNADGSPTGNEVHVNSYAEDYQWYADVVTLDNDNFAVAWCSWEQDGSDGGIYLQKFNLNWDSDNPELLVNSYRENYQWLPKMFTTPGGNIVVIWSSWLQDGSREGIYTKIFNSRLKEVSFEERVNVTQESFQWEPCAAAVDEFKFIALWSGYDEVEKNYDVIGRVTDIQSIETLSVQSSYAHSNGLSTTTFNVNIVDSALITGDDYEISFNQDSNDKFYAVIKNVSTGETKVPEFYLDQGEEAYYLTPVFDGIAVEIKPVFSLEVNFEKSIFVNNSGSNINFNITNPSGTTVVAPLDAAIIWGDASRDDDGFYISPIDSGYSSSAKVEVKTPFTVLDLTNNRRIFSYILEPSGAKNKQWDPGENIVIITPEEYQNYFPNFHVQITSDINGENIVYPAPGDTIFIYTRRPLSTDDVYTFSTASNFITTVRNTTSLPDDLILLQNYPNPFNPSTTISFSIPSDSFVKLKVFNVLGELVNTLKNEFLQKGDYKIVLQADSGNLNLSSGVYFYSLEADNRFITKKMLLIK